MGPLTDVHGEIVTDDSEAANMLNDYFTSVFTEEITEDLPTPKYLFPGEAHQVLNSLDFSPGIIKSRIMKLKSNKAPGCDNIMPRILKELVEEIICPLSMLFTESFSHSSVPDDWKRANVTPLFKKGKRSLAQNYRPVSLTSQVCKLMESVIRDAVVEHLETWGLIFDLQHGIVRGRSCLTNLLKFLEAVTRAVC